MQNKDKAVICVAIVVAIIVIPLALHTGGQKLSPHINRHIKGMIEPHAKSIVEDLQREFHAEIKESVSSVTQKLEAELNEDMLLLRKVQSKLVKTVEQLSQQLKNCKCAKGGG